MTVVATTPTKVAITSKRRSARVLQHDPIVAPGFGTQKDLESLAVQLQLPVVAVETLMKSRGRGKPSEAEQDEAPVSNAWADFMTEQGVSDFMPAAAAAPTTSSQDKKRTYTFEPSTSKKMKRASGVLVQAGTLDSAAVGRSKLKLDRKYDLPVPTRILAEKIHAVFASCNAAHSIAVGANAVYGWGRNETHQLGSALPSNVALPTPLELPGKLDMAALGKGHTLFLIGGTVWSVGLNKAGQCGIKTFTDVPSIRKCVLDATIVQIACGEDFSVALDDEGLVFSTGSSEFGQLGNGETGEYFIAANKLAFANCNVFTRRPTFCHAPAEKLHSNNEAAKVVPLEEDIRIRAIACGKHHTIALEATSNQKPRVFSWGCGNYGCLGHGLQADEYFPRNIGALQHAPLGAGTQVAAGSHCSIIVSPNGHVHYWGKHRSVGEAVMRPQLVDVLANNQHVVTHCAAGGQSVVCSTRAAQTVAWGQGPHGELGLGSVKSSSKPTFVEALNGCRVMDLACGFGHTLYLVCDDDKDDKAAVKKLQQLNPSDASELIAVNEQKAVKKSG